MAEDEPTSTRKDDATSRKKRPPPTTTTTTTDALINECYYHGRLPREDVEYLLKANGDFLIRVSQPRNNDSDRQIILSLLVDKDVDTNIG
uniref:SH2 domain-containing protein n=1 Tax=Panagrolaimus sp. ES5 TaxID=591445 RepID=A0AC34GC83_9BILA